MAWHFLAPETAVPQLLVRALAVYAFLVVGLRLAGRREMGQLTTFDLILLLILSNAVQNSINAGDQQLGQRAAERRRLTGSAEEQRTPGRRAAAAR